MKDHFIPQNLECKNKLLEKGNKKSNDIHKTKIFIRSTDKRMCELAIKVSKFLLSTSVNALSWTNNKGFADAVNPLTTLLVGLL